MAEVAPWDSSAETAPWETAAAPQTSATADFSDDDSPEAAEAKALTGGSEALASLATGTVGQIAGGLGYMGKSATNAMGLTSGDPLETARANAATLTYQPRTAAGQGVNEALSGAMSAGDRPFERAEDYLDPSGNLKATAQDVAERGNYTLGAAAGVAPLLRVPEVTAPRGVPRPEPTAPSAPGGFTRDDFAPRPPEAAPAPTAAAPSAPETPARVPVAGKPHITPKAQLPATAAEAAEQIRAQEGEMGQAGAPEAAAPAAPTSTPSAAPDAKGAPPPDIHDPNFFPAPDNQGLKSTAVSAPEQAARQAAVERGAPTLPQVRDSAITNDYNDQGRDWTGRQAGDPTAVAQTATEANALHNEAGRISGETGGQLGTGEAADTVRGRAYQDWHDSTVAALKQHVDAAYASEDAQAKQIATPASNLKGVLQDDSLIDSANAGSVRNSTHALARNMGVDLTDPNAQMNAYQVEQIRKHAGSIYGNAPRLAQAIKNAADADLPQGAYTRARALNKLKSDMFDNRDGINQLGPSKDINPDTGKPRPENRPVKAPQVMSKIEGMDPDQVRHIVGTVKNSATVLDRLGDHAGAQAITDKALKAAQQLQSHFTERWGDEAGKGGGWNQRRAHQFLTNNQETLAAVMSPEQMHQMRNVSNAANVLDLDKGYKGAFAQFRSGASFLRQRAGRMAEGVITDLLPMGNTIGEATGLSEKARNFLGGANKAESPKNFTRPLGEKLPGQRGAVGLLNKPGIVHDYDPATGEHTVTSPNGVTKGFDQANGNIKISRTDTHPEAQGGGEATLRLQKLADVAHERGAVLNSDYSVSRAAQGPYAALKRMGYDVQKNPNATEKAGRSVSDNISNPVLSVGPRRTGSVPQAGAVPGETPPMGRSIFGGRQAGYIGDPYESAKPAKDVWGNERNVQDRRGSGAPAANTGNPYEWSGDRTKADRSTPAGARLFGGKQRGAVGNLNPKAEPPTPPEGSPQTASKPFKKWFGKSQVVDPLGNPQVVYHGTTSDFKSFNTARANPESDFGSGIYFTNDKDDVSHNYGGKGPDLTNKIEYRKEQLIDEGMESGEAEKQANAEHMQHGGAVIPAYVRMENPAILGGKNETRFSHEYEHEDDDPEKDIVGEKGTLPAFSDALRAASRSYDDVDRDKLENAIQEMHEHGDGLKISDAIKILHDHEGAVTYATDEKGRHVSNEIVRDALQRAGFDGIVDNTVNKKFGSERRIGKPMEGMKPNTVHYIIFHPNQVKSAIGNSGKFSKTNPDITAKHNSQQSNERVA